MHCRLGKAVSRYKNCIVTEVAGRQGAGHWADGRWGVGVGAGVGTGARRRGRWACVGLASGRKSGRRRGSARAEACEARAERSGCGRQARARQVSGSRHGRARSAWGRAGWAAGARLERWARGLARTLHSVHST